MTRRARRCLRAIQFDAEKFQSSQIRARTVASVFADAAGKDQRIQSAQRAGA